MKKELKVRIAQLRAEGKTYNEIARLLTCSKGTISFHLSQSVRENTYKRKRNSRSLLKKKLKKEAGGACTKCGYSKCLDALDFHHINPDTKLFTLGQGFNNKSFSALKAEAKKCILVCANCHRELHADQLS